MRLAALLGPARDSLEALEDREQDPKRLAQLYQIDHALTLARRQAELGQVLCGVPVEDARPQTTALIDVLRAASSAVEYYPRVQLGRIVELAVVQFAADDVIRVLTELIDNATRLSPPQATVTVSTHLTDTGSALVRVEDHGVGMSEDDLAGWNGMLDGGPVPAAVRRRGTARIGLVAVRRLAAAHGLTVRLASRAAGGTTATVAVPERLLVELPVAGTAGGTVLPAVFPAGAPATRAEAPVRLVPSGPGSAGESRTGGPAGRGDAGTGGSAPSRAPAPRPTEARPSAAGQNEPGPAANPSETGHAPDPSEAGQAPGRGETGQAAERGEAGPAADRGEACRATDRGETGRATDRGEAGRAAERGEAGPAADPGEADELPRRVSVSLRETDDVPARPSVVAAPPPHRHLGSWADDVAAFADGTSRAEGDRR